MPSRYDGYDRYDGCDGNFKVFYLAIFVYWMYKPIEIIVLYHSYLG